MSVMEPKSQPLLHFFRSGPMACPYLEGQIERKLFTRLSGPFSAEINSALTTAGFRRSHDIVYRPVCPACQACVPVRIPADGFIPGRSQRRTLRRNADLVASLIAAEPTEEQYRLFYRYENARHGDSDMATMTRSDYNAMLREGQADTWVLELRTPRGVLVGAMLVDRLGDGYSAVYSFFEPSEPGRSLGTYLVMALLDLTRAEGPGFVYLGYWIAGSPNMAYKARFRPLEHLTGQGWELMTFP